MLTKTLKNKECKYGTFSYIEEDLIGYCLEVANSYSEEEVDSLLSIIDENSTVFEIGANIGTITVPLAKKAKIVHAFEPQLLIFNILKQNIEDNGLVEKTVIHQYGLGNSPTKARMAHCNYGDFFNTGGGRVLKEREIAFIYDTINDVNVEITDYFEVNIDTLDNYTKINKIDHIDLLKIDVEGMEKEVLEGGTDIITASRPILYLENHDDQKRHLLIKYIRKLGYRMFWHLPMICDPALWHHPFFNHVYSVNMLCLPPEKYFETSLSEITDDYDDGQVAIKRKLTN